MNYSSKFWLMPVLGILTACGGGGGDNGVTLTPPNYTGQTAPIAVSTNNSNTITKRFLAQANPSDLFTATEAGAVQSTNKRVLALINQNRSAKKNITAATPVQQACTDGGFQTATYDFNDLGQGTFSIDYKSCIEGDLMYMGKVSGSISFDANSSRFVTNFDLALVGLTTPKHIHLSGYTDTTQTSTNNTEIVKNNLMIENVPNGKSVYQKNVISTTVYDNINNPTTGTTTMSGELYFNDIGRVDLTTTIPINISVDQNQNQIFNQGEFLLTGANLGTIRISLASGSSSNTPMATKIIVDTNGDGTPEYEGYNSKPSVGGNDQSITAIVSTASLNRNIGDCIILSARDSEAANGKALSITWNIISKPVDSMSAFANPNMPETTIIPDKAGSYVLELVVSDGVNTHQVQTTLEITAL